MKLRTSALSLLLLSVALPGCKPEEAPLRSELFTDRCAQLFSCECTEYPYADAAQCERVYAVQFAGLAGSAEAAGLTLDEGCLLTDDFYLEIRCKTSSEYSSEDQEETPKACSYCSVAYGTVALGQPCVAYGDGELSDCARGLYCADEVCVDPCKLLLLGEPCRDSIGGCAEGLFCDSDMDACRALGASGESCESVRCVDELTCVFGSFDEAPTCRPFAREGEPCFTNECGEGLVCDSSVNTCVALADLGEPCESTECAAGLACNYDEDSGMRSCGPLPGVGEECFGDCGDGAVCSFESSTCIALPGENEPCVEYACARGLECNNENVCISEQPLLCSD